MVAQNQKFKFVVPDFGKLWKPDITILPCGFGVAECKLTPALSDVFLSHMVEQQRNHRDTLSDRYSSDIANDDFPMTHQGCAFNFVGEFFDGQHRCHGVKKAGRPIDILVFFGVGGAREMSVVDTNGVRTAGDAAKMRGNELCAVDISTVRQFLLFNIKETWHYQTFSNTQVIDTAVKYGTEIGMVRSWFGSPKAPGVDRSPIRAAVLSALVYGCNSTPIERFVKVLCEHVDGQRPRDGAAIALRQNIQKTIKKGSGGSAVTMSLFLRACRAIEHAIAGTDPGSCRESPCNPFRTEDLFAS